MEPLITHTGIVAVLNRGNIDTDQIISKEFLKSIKRTGFGDQLFHHWKYDDAGKPVATFELNRPEYRNASILLTGNNFGCGSSREHAVWAVYQAGFRVLIAPQKQNGSEIIPGFADIFKNNSTKNGLLPLEFSEAEVQKMIGLVEADKGLKATVDLKNQKITFHSPKGDLGFAFNVDPAVKTRFLEGLDDIGQTEKLMGQIESFEKKHAAQMFAS